MGIFNTSLNFVKWNIDRQYFSSPGAIYTVIISCLYVAARWTHSWYFWSHIEIVEVDYFTPL